MKELPIHLEEHLNSHISLSSLLAHTITLCHSTGVEVGQVHTCAAHVYTHLYVNVCTGAGDSGPV